MAKGTTLVMAPQQGLGAAMAQRMRSRGDTVVVVDPSVDATDRTAVERAFAGIGTIDVAVLAWMEPSALVAQRVDELDETQWDEACERMIRSAIVLLQQTHAVVRDGGRVVVVLPTVAATGVAGLVPLCTAVESIRVLTKAVARRWGARGVTVNTIEVELADLVTGGDDGAAVDIPHVPVLGQPSLAPRDTVADVVGLVDLLASASADAITGALLVADRGTVLQP